MTASGYGVGDRRTQKTPFHRAAGFTLTELAIVLLIVGLLLAGILAPLATQVETRRIADTQKTLEEIKEALIGYAASHMAADGKPYLPCPDNDLDGFEENRVANACPSQEGWIPWATLGVGQADAWGNRFRYRVRANFSNSQVGFALDTTLSGSQRLRVCASACSAGVMLADGLPAVILSHGKNGYGARNSNNTMNAYPTSADELENTNGRIFGDTADAGPTVTPTCGAPGCFHFISRPPTPPGTPAGEFDDVVAWLSPNVLFGRMIAAGRLP